MIKNYYEILGVSTDSTYTDIKVAYRKLARKYHPDLNKDDIENAMKHFKEITKAYDTLSNAKRRMQYDILNGIFKTNFGNSFSEFDKDVKTYSTPNFKENASNKDTSNKESDEKAHDEEDTSNLRQEFKDTINEFFEEFKNSNKFKKERLEPKKGGNINADVTITLEEVATGCKKTVNIVHTESCPNCHGRKFINGELCRKCEGKGEVTTHKKITVIVPKGVKNHTKLRIKEEGNAGYNGGKNGDLYLHVVIAPSSKINSDGINLVYHVPISPFEAVLGDEIIVPTYEGNVVLKVPPKTNSGQKFRLTGLGNSKCGKTGDMIIIVDIAISKSLSDDEIRLYEKLKKLNRENLRENILYE